VLAGAYGRPAIQACCARRAAPCLAEPGHDHRRDRRYASVDAANCRGSGRSGPGCWMRCPARTAVGIHNTSCASNLKHAPKGNYTPAPGALAPTGILPYTVNRVVRCRSALGRTHDADSMPAGASLTVF
jgi:hypothetical protein